ncbi:MAG: hypothetical protein ABJK83_09195, partial [Parasphingorhabdus sp.]
MFQLLKSIDQSQEDVLEELDESRPAIDARRQKVDAPQLSDRFRDGPVYASLREGLRERMPPLEPAGYGFLRTLGEKMELSDAEIEKTQSAYATNIRRYSTYASQEDEIHGWRRVAIIGPGIRAPAPGSYHQGDGEYRVFLVDHDGRLSSRSLPANGENNLSVAEILDRAMEDDLFALAAGKFNLNPFSYNFRNTARGAGQTLCEDISAHLFNRRHTAHLVSDNGFEEEVM